MPPTDAPTMPPTAAPTMPPTDMPTMPPTYPPTSAPTMPPTDMPTMPPTYPPTTAPTQAPTQAPTMPPNSSFKDLIMQLAAEAEAGFAALNKKVMTATLGTDTKFKSLEEKVEMIKTLMAKRR